MSSLTALLVELIEVQGPLTFAAYQELCLYHPEHGYYATGPERSGRGGDFVTSPELDPAFGELWARAFAEVDAALGSSETFWIVEIGPGEGGFAEAVLGALPAPLARRTRYVLVERIPALAARQRSRLGAVARPGRITWATDLSGVAAPEGVVFANEVLDNAPVHLVEGTASGVVELYVGVERGTLRLVPGPPSPPAAAALAAGGITLEPGWRAELAVGAAGLARDCARALGRGALFFVDYGLDAAGRAARPAGTLVAHSAGRADDDLLSRPGERDLSSRVDWDAVAAALAAEGLEVLPRVTQRHALKRLGADRLQESLRAEHAERLAAGDGVGAVRALSRRQALAALTDPGGLGGLEVLCALKGTAPPPFLERGGEAPAGRSS